jgi:hypothetical protein
LKGLDTEIKTDSNHTVELDNIKPPPHYDDVEGPQVVTSDTARQGPLGQRESLFHRVGF